ncbi:hypothetical protein Scep_015133 [Stephania cephalantha]|uniref:Uncharacterized protein n=1 Tax=Stephania cephalantha TaxID=152367 RepID=A0AAP0J4R8_9MAGN
MSGASQSITAINMHDNPSLTQGFIGALVKAGSGARHDCVLHGVAYDELDADKMRGRDPYRYCGCSNEWRSDPQ